jgi:predicted TIM-barrel fold metal-dependent hydrolase
MGTVCRLLPPPGVMLLLAATSTAGSTACSTAGAVPRSAADQDLATYVDTVRSIDSHAHPLAYVASGAPADTDYDALPLDGLPPFNVPFGLRADNPAYRDAQLSLYGVMGGDNGSARARAFSQARMSLMQHHREHFPTWVLDQLHIDVMLANRIAMGAGLTSPRFRWVAFADPLMLPLDTRGEAERTPDTEALYPLEAKLLHRYLGDLGIATLPPTLAAYEHDIVSATLERQRTGGAVAIKFEAAYLRPLDFEPQDAAAAAAVYVRYVTAGVPTHAEYKLLEDYLVRSISREAGRLGLAVQIHSTDGFGGFYSPAGAAPRLLDSLFNDPALRTTRFVIVHGGWPMVDETLSQLGRPNVYADISMMDQIAEPAALSRALRMWLAAWPEKVLFGTDAFDGGDQQGWEQVAWIASRNARRGLADALGGMVRDAEVTPARAKQLARMVLRENAIAAYHLDAEVVTTHDY